MARKRKGKDISGWILIDKPAGFTSSQIVNKIRFLTRARKAGHGGTLDPDATGLLPIAIGEATKLIPFLDESHKTYQFEVNWGSQTSTDDASGETIFTSEMRPTLDELVNLLPKYTGQISQIPPNVSAVKVDGKRAYNLAREGVEMDLKARDLSVSQLSIVSHSNNKTQFSMTCGKGGYVRSIGRDLGIDLECYGHISWLRREAALGFSLAQAQTLEEVEQLGANLISINETPLLKQIQIDFESAQRLQNGREIIKGNQSSTGDIFLAMCNNTPIAIVEALDSAFRVKRGLSAHFFDDKTRL